jgi:uncharacterized protein (DUF2267 family)
MSLTGLPAFDTTVHATNSWLKELMQELGWEDRQRAYHALREVFHALRDRLPTDAVAALGAQLPMLVRGIYYEGWHPAGKPLKWHREQFLNRLAETIPDSAGVNLEDVVRAVLTVLARNVTHGEVESVRRALPGDLRSLWPS